MGRNKRIDRGAVLDAAEAIVVARGAAALTIGAVAAASGITKGGVQSCFGTKEAMLAAMLGRWMQEERALFEAAAGTAATTGERVAAHVATTRRYADGKHRRAANLIAVLLQSGAHLDEVRRWYGERAVPVAADDPSSRLARLAFFATEGAFFLRYFNLLPMSAAEWDSILADAQDLAVS